MIALTVPGWGEVRVAHLVLDYNGTLAAGGVLLPGVAPRLEAIHRLGVSLHIVTADTNGTAAQQCAALPVELLVREGGAVAREKAALVERLDPAETAAVGNGRNDVDMLRAAGLSLAVIGDEGAFSGALLAAHVVCRNITEALDLLLLPHRLKASLRG